MLGQDLSLVSELMNYVPSAVVVIDRKASIRLWNRGAEELFKISKERMLGVDVRGQQGAQESERIAAIVEDLMHGRPWEGEIESKRGDSVLSVYYRCSPLYNDQGGIVGAIATAVDLTESRHSKAALRSTEESLRQAQSDFREAIETAGDGFATVDFAGNILDANDTACKLLGYTRDELLSMHVRQIDLGDRENRLRNLAALQHSPRRRFDSQHRRKDGTIIDVEVTISASSTTPNRVFVVVRDTTERKRLEEQFRQAQKMEAIGRLAGGVAHDFNNLLTAIAGYSELLLRGLTADDGRRRDIEEIKRAGERAATLTRQLLALSRKQTLHSRAIDLNSTITEAGRMLSRVIGEDVTIVTELAPQLPPVKADPGQVEQVLLNLAVNARDAMPGGGHLRVSTSIVDISANDTQHTVTIPAGQYVTLAVTDNGTGMDAETRSHLFEPFFTTKDRGKGTGLGLATVYGIVRQSEGYIEVESELGRGTTVRVYLLPLRQPVVATVPAAPAVADVQGNETVLLVEDDPHVREYTVRVLREHGYQVFSAGSGPEALMLVSTGSVHPQLLITDVIMPEMSGHALAEQLCHHLPNLLVIYISGYTDDAIAERGLVPAGSRVVSKPFTPQSLSRRVREVLDTKTV